jgi:hypothetical protein
LSSIAVVRISATSTPTIPNAPVKMVSRKVLAKLTKGVTQPIFAAAARGFGQVESGTKNGGEVALL